MADRKLSPSLLKFSVALGVAAMVATPILAQQRERLSRECREGIVELCGRDRAQIRACLQERFAELSDGCTAELRERMQSARGGEGARRGQPSQSSSYVAPARVDRTVLYGDSIREQVDIFAPDEIVEERPLVLFIHGGGWSMGSHKSTVQAKPAHFTGAGYYFASAGYRLLPNSPVEQQAADLGEATQAVRRQAASIGFDPDQIVLMGHSAGAHLAALLATDPSYAGDAFSAIKGVVLLDGAGYDVAQSITTAEPRAWQIYNAAFGDDPERQAALSPITHVGGPDAPHWLVLYVEGRDRSKVQSEMLSEKLLSAGADAQVVAIGETDHGRLNREMGTAAGAAQTEAVDTFLARILD